jgi:membrane-bound metal-dependent hydrolase YbcI (DUF457 family)
MFLAHLPAGYLVGASVARKWPQAMSPVAWAAVLLGSVAPDLDLLYFYLWSDQSINHHVYPPHVPIVWLVTTSLVGLCLWRGPQRWRVVWAMFCTGWLLHLVLDTVPGGIWWLWPWVTTPYVLIVVPRRFDNAWLNFISHPSILLEVILITCSWQQWRARGKPAPLPLPLPLRVKHALLQPKRPYRTFL